MGGGGVLGFSHIVVNGDRDMRRTTALALGLGASYHGETFLASNKIREMLKVAMGCCKQSWCRLAVY